jgi:hypothetical protein
MLRTGVLTRDQWLDRIDELLIDISKEDDELCLEVLDLVVNRALDMKDDRQDEINGFNAVS